MLRGSLTFVTVVFGAERGLLELQARSLARHLADDAVAEIVVIDNGWRPMSPRSLRRLAVSYGSLADRLRVVRISDVAPGMPPTIGWRSQQIAKLLVARSVGTEHYVLLDAKNHLIRGAAVDEFVGPDGRAHGATHPYTSHPLRPQLDLALRYVGAGDALIAAAMEDFLPTATPFVLSTDLVTAMISDVETSSGRPFAAEFEARRLTEFFLYGAWLAVRGPGVAAAYDGVALPSPTVWPRLRHSVEGVEATVAEAESVDSAFFAVHRTTLARGDVAARRRVARFWAERGLFTDERAARRFIAAFRRAYFPAMVGKKIDERVRSLIDSRAQPSASTAVGA